MLVGVPLQGLEQPLVAATPDTVKKLQKLGYSVAVEAGAGQKSHYPDSQYLEAGAQIVSASAAGGGRDCSQLGGAYLRRVGADATGGDIDSQVGSGPPS